MRRGAILGALAVLAVGGAFVATRLPGDGPASTRPPPVELLAKNLVLFEGPESAMRVAFQPADPSVRVIVTLREPGPGMSFCPLESPTSPLPPVERCRNAQSGVRESVTGPNLSAVAIVLRDTPRALADVRLEYAEGGRDIMVRIPQLLRSPDASGCRDAGCETFLEMFPPARGTLNARVTWRGGPAEVQVLQGRVRAKSFTASGIPYTVADRAEGPSPLSVSAATASESEYALVVRDPGAGPETAPLRDVVIDASWA